MKLLILVVFCVVFQFAFADSGQYGFIEGIINKKLEEFREKMKTGDPALGIPPLAPLEIDHVPVKINIGNILELKGDFKNLRIDNLDHFVNNKLDVSIIKMKASFEFTFPDLIFSGFEDVNAKVFSVAPFWAHGNFSIAPKNVQITGDIKVSVSLNGNLNLKDMNIGLKMEGLDCNIENMLTGGDLSDLLNNMVSEILPATLRKFPEDISRMMKNAMMPILEKIVGSINIKDLTAVL
jgi:hypothetical protein